MKPEEIQEIISEIEAGNTVKVTGLGFCRTLGADDLEELRLAVEISRYLSDAGRHLEAAIFDRHAPDPGGP